MQRWLFILRRWAAEAKKQLASKPADLDSENVLHIRRVIYDGEAEELETERLLSLDAVLHSHLSRRMRRWAKGRNGFFILVRERQSVSAMPAGGICIRLRKQLECGSGAGTISGIL
jgi:hypothetical protein